MADLSRLRYLERLQNAIDYAHTGDVFKAREVLEDILREEPGNVEAWILMARLAPDKAQAVYCLHRVFKFSKSPEVIIWARKRLAALEGPLECLTPPEHKPIFDPPHPTLAKRRRLNWRALLVLGSLGAVMALGTLLAVVMFVVVPVLATSLR